MLSFATEFPVSNQCSRSDFVQAIKSWVLDSPHTVFDEADMLVLFNDDNSNIQKHNQSINILMIDKNSEFYFGVRHLATDKNIDWITEIAFSKNNFEAWVSVRTFREVPGPVVQVPAAKKPVVVRTLLDGLGGGADGELIASFRPHFLNNDDISKASSIILDKQIRHLPVVYISCDFHGKYYLDSSSIASDLCGMAHVVVEPNRAFSCRLQLDVASKNAYGGMIGIYWPDATGQRSFFNPRDFHRRSDLKKSIIDTVRSALLNRRPIYDCTWSAVQVMYSRKEYEYLKSSGSQNIDEYVRIFDYEQKTKDEKILSAENEIRRLKSEIKQHENRSPSKNGIWLSINKEQEYDEGEFLEIIFDAINDSIGRVESEGRRYHVLNDIKNSNESGNYLKSKKEALKNLLRSYKSMDARIRSGLVEMGFLISEEGKHYKLIYRGDRRYTSSLAKSGSDVRGGLNSASDICKKIF